MSMSIMGVKLGVLHIDTLHTHTNIGHFGVNLDQVCALE
jgi:hypothetical protein